MDRYELRTALQGLSASTWLSGPSAASCAKYGLLAGTNFSKRPPLGFASATRHHAVFLHVYSNHRANSCTHTTDSEYIDKTLATDSSLQLY